MPRAATVYRFGQFRVDTREQRLTTRDGGLIPITPKAFDTLVVLLRHAGRLLTKEELLEAVWPGTAVEEANLTVNVSTLRRLLAHSDERPCIETVPRRGYRFVEKVEVEHETEVPLDARPETLPTARAQELYARANQAANEADHWETARDLYEACVKEAPDFAPAWARLARCHRLIAKYTVTGTMRDVALTRAQAAFECALALDESLPLTQSLYAQLEVDIGRASDATFRLLRVIQRDGPNAAAFGGLVHSLRFCGLLEASRTAHHRARALDPAIVTSVAHTYWILGDYEAALRETAGDIGYMPGLALASLGRTSDAIAALRWREHDTRDNRARAFLISLRALLEGHTDESLAALHRAADGLADPEAKYYLARSLAHLAAHDVALALLRAVVDDGYYCARALASDPWLERVRGTTTFAAVFETALARHEEARKAFLDAGGDAILPVDGN
jgi:DNA-binding winged helix-turn-helix (wHTH) protein